MADLFDRLRKTVVEQLAPRSIGGKGMAGLLIRKERTYNPDTDMNEVVDTTYDISGLKASYKLHYVDGSLIRMGDVKFDLSPSLLDGTVCPTPTTSDQIQLDGKVYTVVTVANWNGAGDDLGWVLQLRTV